MSTVWVAEEIFESWSEVRAVFDSSEAAASWVVRDWENRIASECEVISDSTQSFPEVAELEVPKPVRTGREAPRSMVVTPVREPIVVVDDLRDFGLLEATYLRSLAEALAWWETYREDPEPVDLWLDHDLGGYEGEDDVRPLVAAIEEHLMTVGPLPMRVRILTDNPAARRWIRQALSPHVPVEEAVPMWRIVGSGDSSDA